jgi:hypothetical protein
MKKVIITVLVIVSMIAVAYTNSKKEIPVEEYTVHEWGTFTSVSRSDGRTLEGLYLEEEELPRFVHEFKMLDMRGMKANMGQRNIPHMNGVNIKMETPVLYFYSDKERNVKVNVKFKGGIINQWYPRSFAKRVKSLDLVNAKITPSSILDFGKNYQDSIDWQVKVLAPDSYLSYTSPQNLETPTWVNPRFTDANMLQIGEEREKFIFYRGLARFNQPLVVSAQSNSQITLNNISGEDIGFALVYEYTKDKKAKVWWTGKVTGNSTKIVSKGNVDKDQAIYQQFLKGLTDAGLYKKEALSMLETWRHSYFEKEGLRVFWVVPRKFTDEILPLELSPAPKNLERVLVGRTEVMTPEFEQEIAQSFLNNKNASPYWYRMQDKTMFPFNFKRDRLLLAWQQRARETLSKTTHRFSFLKKISPAELPYGNYYINKDEKGKVTVQSISPFDGGQLMTYTVINNKIQGDVTYMFPSAKMIKQNTVNGTYYCDRRAVFTMKDNRLEGECRIYDLYKKDQPLLESYSFKEGEVVLSSQKPMKLKAL